MAQIEGRLELRNKLKGTKKIKKGKIVELCQITLRTIRDIRLYPCKNLPTKFLHLCRCLQFEAAKTSNLLNLPLQEKSKILQS